VAPVEWPLPFWKVKVEGRSVVARYVSLSKLTPEDLMETGCGWAGLLGHSQRDFDFAFRIEVMVG